MVNLRRSELLGHDGAAKKRKWYRPVSAETGGPYCANRVPAANRHRSERAHPRLPWHSRCPLAGIGRGTECCAWRDAPRFAAKPQVQGRLASGEEFGPSRKYAPTAAKFKPRRTHSASLAGQAMNRYRGAQAEFQFSIVAPHTAHSKLLISRSATMCSLRS